MQRQSRTVWRGRVLEASVCCNSPCGYAARLTPLHGLLSAGVLRAFLLRDKALAHSQRESVDPSFVLKPLQLLDFNDAKSSGFVENVVELCELIA